MTFSCALEVVLDFAPYPLDDDCPCGSGRRYRDCCDSKDFEFGLDETGAIIRRVPLAGGAIEAFEEAMASFEELYGRRPEHDGLVFGHLADPTESVHAEARELIVAGLDPAYVYAFVRSDGLLPTELNTDLIAGNDLELFGSFVSEFRAPVDLGRDEVPSFVFVTVGNDLIAATVDTARSRMRMVLVDLLSRHMSDDQRRARMEPRQYDRVEFAVRSPFDYALFSALKTKRTLDSLQLLSTGGDPASIHALARSVFENTVYLDSIAEQPSLFWDGISPKTDSVNFEFGRHPDGSVNVNRVIHKRTGVQAPTNVRFRDLVQKSDRTHTRELYALFYVTASQYIHVDVLSARSYFADPDPFDQLDQTTLASLLSVVLIGDLLRALAHCEGIQERFAADVQAFLNSMVDTLVESLTYVNSDPNHVNEVFDTLRDVVVSWRTAPSSPSDL